MYAKVSWPKQKQTPNEQINKSYSCKIQEIMQNKERTNKNNQ